MSTLLLLLLLAQATEPASTPEIERSIEGDVLLIARSERAQASDLPARGRTMNQVEAEFGPPDERFHPVGEPPITRWRYAKFTVYFEGEHVINAVLNRTSADEKGPRQPLK